MPLTLSLVTPEKTLLTAAADSVRLPLHDGMAGILPGRAQWSPGWDTGR